jgi:phosphate acetyltransferase
LSGLYSEQIQCPKFTYKWGAFGYKPPSLSNAVEFITNRCEIFSENFHLLGAIHFNPQMLSPRTYDMAKHLGAKILHEGELMTRRVVDVKIIARSVKNMLFTLRPNTLIVTPADRDDIILAVCMASLNGVPLAGLVLTGEGGGLRPEENVLKLCEKAFKTGLPLLLLESDSYTSAFKAASIDMQVPVDDIERIHNVMDYTAESLRIEESLLVKCAVPREPRLSPAAFMYMLVNASRETSRRIVLPEGHDPRIIKAAEICHDRKIARCVLLKEPN